MRVFEPKRTKFKKTFMILPNKKGVNTYVLFPKFGNLGIKAKESGYVTPEQLETIRRFLIRHIRGVGKIWILIRPYAAITSKPLDVRMGKGKGLTKGFVYPVKKGQIIIEMYLSNINRGRLLLEKSCYKLGLKTIIVQKS